MIIDKPIYVLVVSFEMMNKDPKDCIVEVFSFRDVAISAANNHIRKLSEEWGFDSDKEHEWGENDDYCLLKYISSNFEPQPTSQLCLEDGYANRVFVTIRRF